MNTINSIESSLNKISILTTNRLPINDYLRYENGSDGEDIEIYKEREHAYNLLKKFINDFNNFSDFLDADDLSNIKYKISNLESFLVGILDNQPFDFGKNKDLSSKILSTIFSLPDILQLTFYNTGRVNRKSIIELLKHINLSVFVFQNIDIDRVLKSATIDENRQMVNLLIQIKNAEVIPIGAIELSNLILKLSELFREINERLRKINVSESIEQLEDKAIEIKENVGLSSNSNLIEVFKNESSSDNKKIFIYNISIFCIFSLSLLSLLSLICLSIFTEIFKKSLSFHFYGFYISFFLFLSALLAYLIKERKRLLNHKYYCTITYLELSALPMYTVQINDKTKQDDFIIHLGDRYFKGPNPSTSNDDITNNITTSKLTEAIKLAQEVKSTLK